MAALWRRWGSWTKDSRSESNTDDSLPPRPSPRWGEGKGEGEKWMTLEKRVYIETYGCQMNEHDSERILRLLEGSLYSETKEAREADLILINTCSVREKPEHKVYSALGRFRKLKEEKGTIIGVAGCVAQQEGERLLDRVPYLDMVIGTHAIPLITQLLERVEVSGQRVCETGFDQRGEYLRTLLPQKPPAKVKSYVTTPLLFLSVTCVGFFNILSREG